MKRAGLIFLLGLVPTLLASAVHVGDPAPEIHFDKLWPQQPIVKDGMKAFAGKAIVLEMWATWCGACIWAIPHVNELAEKFKGRPIVFLSVTDEEPAVVEEFLKKRPVSTSSKKTSSSSEHTSRPPGPECSWTSGARRPCDRESSR